MRRWGITVSVFVLLVALATCALYGYGCLRTIDGRNAAAWLAYAQRADRSVAYHAEGHSTCNGARMTFQLDQEAHGRYRMRFNGGACPCGTLGFDGQQLWWTTGEQTETITAHEKPPILAHATSWLDGNAVVAGRRAVRITAVNGAINKQLAIDRDSGVILAMTTTVHHRPVSSMTIEKISYQPVTAPGCAQPASITRRAADAADLRLTLGGDPLKPTCLPNGLQFTGAYLGACPCCGRPMAILCYSNGLTTLTLFEMGGPNACAMGAGCCTVPSGHDLMVTRTVHGIAVTAVGDLSEAELGKILGSLRS